MPSFKVKFNMEDYMDIAPKHLLDDTDNIINYDEFCNDDFDKCVWKKEPNQAFPKQDYKEVELNRVLRDGVWIAIKDELLWLPPNYYFALRYNKVGDEDLQFRLKRLKHVYFKIRARNNPRVAGTYTVKNRADGETTIATCDGFWETLDGNMTVGQIGIQSKTRADAVNPCWRSVQNLWQNIPRWFKDELCSDFSSGDNIAEKMRFMRDADDVRGIASRNIVIEYFPAVFNAMDGRHNMRKCILDEINKWKECSFYDTFTNYSKFIMPGLERRGMFDIFSSPSDTNGKHNDEAYQLWKDSNPDEITETGSTKSRILRYYSNPLEGIQGAYDKWGDADPQQIYDHIVRERKNKPKDKLMGEIRGFPLNEEEMFGSFEGGHVWSNADGIKSRKVYLLGTKVKDRISNEPVKIFGNLEWREGVIDSDVDFRMADKDSFDLQDARFCFTVLPQNKESLKDIYKPPPYVENCLGIDPFNNRYEAKNVVKQSNAAAINFKFRDVFNSGVVKMPTMIYDCRPRHQDIFFEDMIKAAVFNRSLVQYENRNDKLANYFEDRGFFDWLLPEIGASASSKRKGDAPSGKGKFLEEIIGLIDAYTNIPVNPNERCLLERMWFYEILDDLMKFNPKDTHENNITMAFGQALIGAVKIMYKKIRQKSQMSGEILNYLLN